MVCLELGDSSTDLRTGDSESEEDVPEVSSRLPIIVIISPIPLSGPGDEDGDTFCSIFIRFFEMM